MAYGNPTHPYTKTIRAQLEPIIKSYLAHLGPDEEEINEEEECLKEEPERGANVEMVGHGLIQSKI